MARIGASGIGGAQQSGNVDGGASDSIYLTTQVINGGTASIVAEQIQLRRDSAADWTSTNPTLAQGEQGYEADTDRLKIGDGVTTWNSLPYTNFGGVSTVTATFPIASSGGADPVISLSGIVAIANGGTSSSTQATAITALTGTQASGTYLRSNGTGAALSVLQATDLSGTVAIANGGTGQVTANSALNALLPSQTGNAGDFLTTNGTSTSWSAGGGSGITQLTGDVTAGPGSGSQAALVAKIQGVSVGTPTGTTNVVFSASPTLTGTVVAANITMSGTLLVPTIDGLASGGALSVNGGTAASNAAGGNVTVAGASGSSVGSGGAGGSLTLNGGAANGDNTLNQSGGAINLTAGTSKGSGTGGTITINCGTGGTGTSTAGATGGTVNVNGGTGGAGSATSGNGGGATLKAGSGGGGVAGGTGGQASLTGGTGGTGSASGGNGGAAQISGGSPGTFASANGGAVTISGAGGSGTGAGGAGGAITMSSGAAGGDNTQNNNGGTVTISCGSSKGSSSGPNVSITAGTGGVGTAAVGANGGTTNITAGAGGVGSATGGTGGNVIITAGAGGNSGTPGAGGYISLQPAATISASEVMRVTSSNISITNAPVSINTAGFGVAIKSGSNCKTGTAVLAAGTVTVLNTSVTANSSILLASQSDGGAVGFLRITAKTASTSFVITSSSATDTSTVAWFIVERL